MAKLTQKELERLCLGWQRRLRLLDWDVKVKLCREREFVDHGRQGEVEYSLINKQAVIHILDPVDFPSGDWDQDQEKTLIHELLHLHTAPFSPEADTLQGAAEEWAINSIAAALVELKRPKK
jgi:hypothetical protein